MKKKSAFQVKLFAIAFFLFFVAAPAFGEVLLTEKVKYYSVGGYGKSEITKNLKKYAPHKKGNDSYPAYTQTDLKYEYSWGKRGSRCTITKVKIYLDLTYVYPKLTQPQSKRTQKWWDEKIRKFEIHEKIHGSISKRSAHELDRKMRSLTDINCSNAKQTIASRAKFILRQMKKAQKDYDRITEHGIKQHKYRGPK